MNELLYILNCFKFQTERIMEPIGNSTLNETSSLRNFVNDSIWLLVSHNASCGTYENSSNNGSLSDQGIPPIDVLNAVSSPVLQAVLVCMYCITALLSVLGNVTVIVVLCCRRSTRRRPPARRQGSSKGGAIPPQPHQPCHPGLRLLLINLAVSDVTMAVFCIPFTYTQFMLNRWIFSVNFCPIVQFMQMCSVMASVLTLTLIGIDR